MTAANTPPETNAKAAITANELVLARDPDGNIPTESGSGEQLLLYVHDDGCHAFVDTGLLQQDPTPDRIVISPRRMPPNGRRLMPTGECWCGCGKEPAYLSSFFVPGHERKAVMDIVMAKYGSTAEFVYQHRNDL